MWVPSIQGFTDPQISRAETTGQAPATFRRTQRRNWNPRNSQLPPVLNSCWTNSNCCPKKATLTISSSFWEKGTSEPAALVPLQREHKSFGGKKVIKERVTLNIWKRQRFFFFFWFAKLRTVPASKSGLCTSSLWAQSDTGGNESLSQ